MYGMERDTLYISCFRVHRAGEGREGYAVYQLLSESIGQGREERDTLYISCFQSP